MPSPFLLRQAQDRLSPTSRARGKNRSPDGVKRNPGAVLSLLDFAVLRHGYNLPIGRRTD